MGIDGELFAKEEWVSLEKNIKSEGWGGGQAVCLFTRKCRFGLPVQTKFRYVLRRPMV